MKTKEMTERKYKKAITLGLSALMLFGAAGTYAYFTDHHTVMNEFTVGQVKSELTEPGWTSGGKETAKEIRPNMTLVKDPVIKNTGKSASYNFISFRVPYGKFAAMGTFGAETTDFISKTGQCTDFDVNAEGKVDVTEKDLFRHVINETDWMLVETKTGADYHEYTYAYATGEKAANGLMKELAPGASTTALFKDNKIQVINLVEDEWALQNSCISTETKEFNIPVRAYSIQTTDIAGTDGNGKKDPATVWTTVKTQIDAKYSGMSAWGNTTGTNDTNGNDVKNHIATDAKQ